VITGLGVDGYRLAVQFLATRISNAQTAAS